MSLAQLARRGRTLGHIGSFALPYWLRVGIDGTTLFLGLGALALYLPGIWWGLPNATGPEVIHGWDVDSVSGTIVLAEFHNLLIEPKPDWWVAYPLFHYIILGILYAPYLAYLFLSGGLSAPSAAYPYGLSDPVGALVTLALIGRLATAAMAAGIVVAAYHTAKTVWDRRTGVLAALVAMLVAPMFYYARTGNLDVPVLFWMSLVILVLARSLVTGLTVWRGVWLGVLAALAVATKDQAYGALLPAMAVLVVVHFRRAVAVQVARGALWRPVLALLGSGAAAYAVASGLVFSPHRFYLHLQYVVNFKNTFYTVVRPDGQVLYGFGGNLAQPSTPEGYARLLLDVLEATAEALGPFLLLVAVVGLVLSWRSAPFTKLLIVMGLGHMVLVVLPVMHMQYRYSLFLAFVLTFPVARALALGWSRRGTTKALAVGVAVLGLGWLAIRGVDLTYQMLYDARLAAGNYLAGQLRPGDQVGFFGGVNQLPALPHGVTALRLPSDASALDVLAQDNVRYVLVSPDAWSDAGMDQSWLLAEPVYERLKDGSLGYSRLARFATSPLLPWPLKYLPIVNPTVQVFGP